MAVPSGPEHEMPSSLPPPPFSVEYLEQYLVVLKRFAYLVDVAESSECGLDAFLAVAEYRYTLYLGLLARQCTDESMILPPWDVAIIWHAHLRFPHEYLADVIHRPAYSRISTNCLDFNLAGLAQLVDRDVWSDPASQAIWNEGYPEVGYQVWDSLPSKTHLSASLTLHQICMPCPYEKCGVNVYLLAPQLARFRTDDESVYCNACECSFKKADVFFANLRSDWRVVQTQSNSHTLEAIKGAFIDGKGQPNYHARTGGWVRSWSMQCLQDVATKNTQLNVDDAVERLEDHWGPQDRELLSAFQKTIPHTYKSHVWPNLSIHLAAAFVKEQRYVDRGLSDAEWTADRGALSSALQRYLRYSYLRGKGWDMYLHPDIRLVRDAHRLIPSSYHRWCEDHIGERLVAGPGSLTDRTHQTDDIRQRTIILWKENFDDIYRLLGSDAPEESNATSSYSDSESTGFIQSQSACETCPKNIYEAESASSTISQLQALYEKPLQGSEFRLLRFKYTCMFGMLHYELTQHNLDFAPDYTATSYVWGPPYLRESDGEMDDAFDGVRIISCNNIFISITRNSYALLEKLSILVPQLCVWMDCLCINQKDDNEKSEQVLRMDRIYTKASHVFVWLGPDHVLLNDFHWACTTLQIRCEEVARETETGLPLLLNDSQFWNDKGVPNAFDRFRKAVLFSALCRWFTRTWVVQEAILARNITVLCGFNQLPWVGISWLGRTFSTSAPLAELSLLPKGLEWSDSIGRRAWQIQAHRGRLLQRSTHHQAATTETSRLLNFLLDHIETFQNTECFDDRDKVYAMLAVARSKLDTPDTVVSNILTVDYKNLSWQDVYFQLAKAAVEHLETLIILNYVKSRRFNGDEDPDLPSWVPDFSFSINITFIHQRALLSDPFKFWANNDNSAQKPLVQDGKLFLRGLKIGRILDESEEPEYPEVMRHLPILVWLKLCASAKCRDKASTQIETLISTAVIRNIRRTLTEPGLDYGPLKQSFHSFIRLGFAVGLWQCQTTATDDYDDLLNEVQDTLHLFHSEIERGELPTLDMILEAKAWKTVLEDTNWSQPERNAATASLLQLEQAATLFKRGTEQMRMLFLTQNGALGLGPMALEPNDEVWAIASADVPFVLRPVETNDGLKTFRLIGDCYLHEYMQGEMMEDDPNIDQKLEPIVLV